MAGSRCQLEPIGENVYVAGSFTKVNGNATPGLVRVGTNGIDPTFASTVPLSYRVMANPDGTLYVTNFGRVEVSTVASQVLYRLNADGSRVSGFTPVNVEIPAVVPFLNARIEALARAEEDVLIGGVFVLDWSGSGNPFFDPTAMFNLARVNPDGSLDREQPRPILGTQSFGTPIVQGLANTTDGSGDLMMTAGTVRRFHDGTPVAGFQVGQTNGIPDRLLCLSNGDTIVGGTFTIYNGTARGHIVRITPDGSQR